MPSGCYRFNPDVHFRDLQLIPEPFLDIQVELEGPKGTDLEIYDLSYSQSDIRIHRLSGNSTQAAYL